MPMREGPVRFTNCKLYGVDDNGLRIEFDIDPSALFADFRPTQGADNTADVKIEGKLNKVMVLDEEEKYNIDNEKIEADLEAFKDFISKYTENNT